jgi:uncharacterized membrane protein required for colicin V production
MRITFFDVLFLLAMIGGGALGWYRGLIRSAAGTVIIYISTVVSTLGYRSVSRMLGGATASYSQSGDVLSFIILMAILNILLRLMSKEWLDNFDTKRMGIWVNITGMVFGFINLAVVCAVLLMIIRSATGGEEWFGYSNVQKFFRGQVHGSWKAYVFSPFMRFLLAIIRPWLFGHSLPPLLVGAL